MRRVCPAVKCWSLGVSPTKRFTDLRELFVKTQGCHSVISKTIKEQP